VHRHESLRTRFVELQGVPYQHVDARGSFELEMVDLSAMPSLQANKEAKEFAEKLATEKVDVSVGPLFDAKLLKLRDREHVLVLVLDHLITDDVSLRILTNEIWILYDQSTRGLAISLPELRVQFADYAVWQENTREIWRAKHEAYWKNRLIGAPSARLPAKNIEAATDLRPCEVFRIPFGRALSDALRDLARWEGTPLSLLALAMQVGVTSRWCNQSDMVVAFVSNGRFRPELEGTIGFIANQLHLRFELREEHSYMDLLKGLEAEFLSAFEHQDFDRVPDFVPDCAPGSHLQFNWTHSYIDKLSSIVNGLEIQPMQLSLGFPIQFYLSFRDDGAAIAATVLYRPDFLALVAIEGFGRNLTSFAEDFVKSPRKRIRQYQ
jgi:hypothetical protein